MKRPVIHRSVRFRAAGLVKSSVLRQYGIPFSRFGLEPGLVPFLPQSVPITLVDVGAASGEFSATIADHCGLSRGLLIEPQPEWARTLAQRFDEPSIVVKQCAVSDRSGSVQFEVLDSRHSSSMLPMLPDAGGGGTRLSRSVRDRITVETRTLDSLVDDAGFNGGIDLLKIDTQGAELHVLRGAVRTLPRVRLIWIEVSFVALYEGSALFGEVHAFLKPHGFRLYSMHDGFRGSDGELLQADALFLSPAVQSPA